mgnify:CR=1 FL=1
MGLNLYKNDFRDKIIHEAINRALGDITNLVLETPTNEQMMGLKIEYKWMLRQMTMEMNKEIEIIEQDLGIVE